MQDFCSDNLVIQTILNNAPLGLVVIDPKGEIMLCNAEASSILGVPARELLNRGWGELFLEDERNTDFNQVIFDVIMKEEVEYHRKATYYQPGGSMRRLSLTSSFLHEDDQVAGIVVILDDITELALSQQREKDLLLENSRIQQEKIDSLQTLALAVAHQIRNPSMIIGGVANRLLKTLSPQSAPAFYLEKIISGVKRLEGIVASVTEYVALSSISPQKISLSLLIARAGELVERRAAEKTVKIDCRFMCDEGTVVLDPDKILKALDEIILNSLDFRKGETAQIEIGARMDERGFHLSVKDRGIGIQARDRPFIFDLFFSTKADGIGMGLPKVRRIVNEHQGGITVASSPGEGTEATIFMPRLAQPGS